MIKCTLFPENVLLNELARYEDWDNGIRKKLRLYILQCQNLLPPKWQTTQLPPAQRQQGTSSYNLCFQRAFCFIISQTCYFVFSSRKTHNVLTKDIYIFKALLLTGFSFFLSFWRSVVNNSELHTERTCKALLFTYTRVKGPIFPLIDNHRVICVLWHTVCKSIETQE